MMRKFTVVALVAFTGSVFALSGISQPRRRGQGRRPVATAEAEPPLSPRIVQELGPFRWGMTHEEVLEQFRQRLRAEYQPRLKNKGQIEQFRLIDERNGAIRRLEQSYVLLDGETNHRRWDTSFVGNEYTHSNNESMLMYEDERQNREFFLFLNDRLWKRVQARNTNGQRIQMDDFATRLEGVFGPGRRVDHQGRLFTVAWRDEHTRLRVRDETTFYSAFLLIYEDLATLAQLSEARRSLVPQKAVSTAQTNEGAAEVGNTTGDPNADIVDRITGKMRRVQNAEAGTAASGRQGSSGTSGSNAGTRPTGTTGTTPPTPPPPDNNDPLGGLGGL